MALFLALIALLLHVSASNSAGIDSPKIVLMGDSIMAEGTPGWGHFFRHQVNLPVENEGVAGSSARSYTRNGHFSRAINLLQKGDFAVVAFGMNDVGNFRSGDDGRTDCPGSDNETCNTNLEKGILTYSAYIRNAAKEIREKGAILVLCGPIPRNPWATGSFQFTPSRFGYYAKAVAESFGDPTVVTFLDHGLFVAYAYRLLGANTVNSFYTTPKDEVHPNAKGMQVVSDAFVHALRRSQNPLKNHLE